MKSFFKIIFSLILISFITVNIKVAFSSHWQFFLIYDYNDQGFSLPYNDVGDKISDDFPNISQTALPMKYLKARYLINMDSINKAKNMLYKAIELHPDHMAPIQLLASIYLKEENIDSAYILSKEAFNKMPNHNIHRATYFEVLRKLKKVDEIDVAFDLVKNNLEPKFHWYDYIFSKIKLQNNKEEIKILINEFREKFPNDDLDAIEQLENMTNVGSESYNLFAYLSGIGDAHFREENYNKAVEFYELALNFNKESYLLYENLAIAYDLSENYPKALDIYNLVIDKFKPLDGRVEFYKGLMLIKTGKANDGCMALSQAVNKNFILETPKIAASSAYISLCSNN